MATKKLSKTKTKLTRNSVKSLIEKIEVLKTNLTEKSEEIELKSALEHMKTTFKKGDVLYTQLIKKTPNGTVYFRLRYIKDNRPYQCTYHYSKIMSDNLTINSLWKFKITTPS